MQDSAKQLIEARTLKGFRDLLPGEAEVKAQMIQTLEGVFRSFGFPKIETPHLEYTEVLLGDAGAEINKQVYRFTDHGKRDVALRFDLTVPFARYVVQHRNDLGMPFKRYAIGSVFRGENTQAGRYREFSQCDFDIIGSQSFDESRSADAEIIQVMAASLDALGVENYTVRINNRKVFNGICQALGVSDKTIEVLRIVDKVRKIGEEKVKEELGQIGLSNEQSDEILKFVNLSAGKSSQETLQALLSYKGRAPLLEEGINELEQVFAIVEKVDAVRGKVLLDLSIARGLGYYTGIVYETYLNDYQEIGSVCSGGRYSNLTATFSKDRFPGVGASVGLDRLIAALEKLKGLSSPSTPAQLLVMTENQPNLGDCHNAASKLRALGFKVEVYPEVAKVGNQFKYAERKGHKFVLRLTEENGKVIFKLKELATQNEQRAESVEDLAKFLS